MFEILFLRLSQYARCVKTDVRFKPCQAVLFKSVLSDNRGYSRSACFHARLCLPRLYDCYVRNYHSNFGVYGFCSRKGNTHKGRYKLKYFSKI